MRVMMPLVLLVGTALRSPGLDVYGGFLGHGVTPQIIQK